MRDENLNKVVDLSKFDNSWYNIGRGKFCVLIWYFVNVLFIKNRFNPSSTLKVFALRAFGAKIGKKCVIKPGVNIKYPWNLKVGNNVWIGEDVWIDNLAKVEIGSNACISQGAMLLCGNHNYNSSTFDLIIGEIHIEEGAWVGAQSVVCPKVTMKSHSVLSVGSVASSNLEAYSIYRGNPAIKVKDRVISD